MTDYAEEIRLLAALLKDDFNLQRVFVIRKLMTLAGEMAAEDGGTRLPEPPSSRDLEVEGEISPPPIAVVPEAVKPEGWKAEKPAGDSISAAINPTATGQKHDPATPDGKKTVPDAEWTRMWTKIKRAQANQRAEQERYAVTAKTETHGAAEKT
jgi:hypothetical protein